MKEMKLRNLVGLFLTVAMLTMFGCGGGGGGGGTTAAGPAGTAVVAIATTGTGAIPVGGVAVMLNYSSSKYSLPPNNTADGLNPKVVASGSLGLAAGTVVQGTLLSAGHVNLAMLNAAGATGGEFATVTFTLLPGKTPTQGDFTVSLPFTGAEGVFNTSGVQIPGASVVSSATIQ